MHFSHSITALVGKLASQEFYMRRTNFLSNLFLNSCILKDMFASIFATGKALSFSLHAWFGGCRFFGHYLGNTLASFPGRLHLQFLIACKRSKTGGAAREQG